MTLPSIDERSLMLAVKSQPFSRPGWLFAPKFDGYRCMARKDGQRVQLITRKGKDATSWYPQIVRSLSSISGSFILDCEVCAIDESGRPDFEALSPRPNGVKAGRMAALFAFDLLYCRRDVRPLMLTERLGRLRELLPEPRPHLLVVTHIEEAGRELFDELTKLGMEGVMAKKADSSYIAGRSRMWLKFKREGYHDGWKRHP